VTKIHIYIIVINKKVFIYKYLFYLIAYKTLFKCPTFKSLKKLFYYILIDNNLKLFMKIILENFYNFIFNINKKYIH